VEKYRQKIGELGEQIAINHLRKQGFTILNHHYTTHWGELDIIAQKNEKMYFFEVKTRVGEAKGKPYEAVTYYKLRSLRRAMQQYLIQSSSTASTYSLDVISIVLDKNLQVKDLALYTGL
jgi:putative endonuclease